MKKALAILMVLALIGSAAFAQPKIGAWGRAIIAPVNNGDDTFLVSGKSWDGFPGTARGRVGFNISGSGDQIGFSAATTADGGPGAEYFNIDGYQIWAKPIEQVTFRYGLTADDTLRGNAAFGSFNWIRALGAGQGEDVTFTRLGSRWDGINLRRGNNFFITAKPIDPLFVGIMFGNLEAAQLFEDAVKNFAQYQIGYTIDGVGLARFQYGAQDDGTTNNSKIEAAFKLTAVENLYADFGFRMNVDSDVSSDKTISAYAKYNVSGMNVHGIAIVILNDDVDTKMNIGVGVDKGLDGGLTVEADVRFYNDIWAGLDSEAEEAMKITAFAGVTKGLGNGKMGVGFQLANHGADTVWALPILMEYWF